MPKYVLFVDKKSFVHTLDPRVKLFFVVNVFIWSSSFNHPFYTASLLALVAGLAVLSRTIKDMKFFVVGLTSLSLMSVILWPIFRNRGTQILFNLFGADFYVETFMYSTAVGMRLVAMVLSGLVFLTTTKIEDLEAGLTKMRIPYPIAFGFSAVFRFIPTMVGDGQMILAAQQARGVNLLQGNVFTKLRNSASIIAPLFITTMRRFGELPMAIESRGFVPFAGRAYYIQVKIRKRDYLFTVWTISLSFIFVYLRLSGHGAVYPDVI